MRARTTNILGKKAVIEAHALSELLHAAIGRLLEHTGTRGTGHGRLSARVETKPPNWLPGQDLPTLNGAQRLRTMPKKAARFMLNRGFPAVNERRAVLIRNHLETLNDLLQGSDPLVVGLGVFNSQPLEILGEAQVPERRVADVTDA